MGSGHCKGVGAVNHYDSSLRLVTDWSPIAVLELPKKKRSGRAININSTFVPVVVDCDVHVDNVAVLQRVAVGDTVANHFIDL